MQSGLKNQVYCPIMTVIGHHERQMNEITITTTAAPLALSNDAVEYAQQSKAKNTVKAYASDWQQFTEWCSVNHYDALPAAPVTVSEYVTQLAKRLKVATINRRLSAISEAHKLAGYMSPTTSPYVENVMSGIRRAHGTRQKGKAAATTNIVKQMVATCDDTFLGVRDRALLLIGFAGAFRRSELVALNVENIEIVQNGLAITIERSKTDQEGQGRTIGIPKGNNTNTCPVRALERWLEIAGIKDGAIFRGVNRWGEVQPSRLSDKGVARAIKRAAESAGLDESVFSGHSLRAGLATSAAAAGVEERDIARQTGHKNMDVLRRYIRDGTLFDNNAASKVGL